LPLSKPEGYRPVCMANLLGRSSSSLDLKGALGAAMQDPSVHVHWYGKAEMRPGRKMGHLSVVGKHGELASTLVDRAIQARERFFEAH
jgi:5-(carboxyamino)imidazole ribonucleotide synthase